MNTTTDNTSDTPTPEQVEVAQSAELKLPAEWCKLKRIKILDADGWIIDQKPWDIPITEDEFENRVVRCTIQTI